MGATRGATRASFGRSGREWPTWLALAGCYGLWGLAIFNHTALGWWVGVPVAVLIAFHSSLQHEILHGHPTRSATVNEALVFPALGLFIPYRRFRDLHLTHHNDARLTDPYDDPESFYLAECDWNSRCSVMRSLLALNATFAGRIAIGPALAMWAFWRSEARLIRAGDRQVRQAWSYHGIGVLVVLAVLWLAGVNFLFYALCAAYPGMSLIMIRSFIEHRAGDDPATRTAIIDAGWFWRLLYLNNNYHAVHHDQPALAWYLIPARWQQHRDAVLSRNGAYYVPGYGAVMWRWLFRGREPVVHPLLHKSPVDQAGDAP